MNVSSLDAVALLEILPDLIMAHYKDYRTIWDHSLLTPVPESATPTDFNFTITRTQACQDQNTFVYGVLIPVFIPSLIAYIEYVASTILASTNPITWGPYSFSIDNLAKQTGLEPMTGTDVFEQNPEVPATQQYMLTGVQAPKLPFKFNHPTTING